MIYILNIHLGNKLRYSFITLTFIANTWQHCFERQSVGLIRSIAIRDKFTNIITHKYRKHKYVNEKVTVKDVFILNFTFPRSSDCLCLHVVKNSDFIIKNIYLFFYTQYWTISDTLRMFRLEICLERSTRKRSMLGEKRRRQTPWLKMFIITYQVENLFVVLKRK